MSDPSARLRTDTYRNTRAAWARIWQEEADLRRELATLEYPRSRQARQHFLPHLPPDGLILEAGCGMGIQLVDLRRRGYRLVGIDYAVHALRPLQDFEPGHRLAGGDIHTLPFADGAFSAYLSFGVVEHFEFGPGPALAEAWRVLAPAGTLVLAVPYPNLVWRLSHGLKRHRRAPSQEKPRYFETAYATPSLEGWLQRAGFDVVARHPIAHSFTLWGLGGPFRGRGYYATSALAEALGRVLARLMPWGMCFESLIIARKQGSR